MLKKQVEFMWLQTDPELAQMGPHELWEILHSTDYPVREGVLSIDQMRHM